MSNFHFLKPHYLSLHRAATFAETRARTEPESAARYARLALEEVVHRLYDEHFLELPYNKSLASRMQQPGFREVVPSRFLDGLKLIRTVGNRAAHYGKTVKAKDALVSVQYLYGFLRWFARVYAETEIPDPGPFDAALVPKIGAARSDHHQKERKAEFEREKKQLAAERAALQRQVDAFAAEQEALKREAAASRARAAQLEQQQAERAAALDVRRRQRAVPVATEFTEAETRRHLIDLDLAAAGWDDLQPGRELEYPVQLPPGPDNPNGNGFVDYVLWGANGKPLAVVEAKRTRRSVEEGRYQASRYADALERQFGQRPVIFLSNGYETYLYDDTFYAATRRVHGFFTRRELERMIERRRQRRDPRTGIPDADIAGRPYQLAAIQRVAETLVDETGTRGARRAALLVMATGSGKTRTAAALTKLLTETGWTQRTLFLADRKTLVRQAKESFSGHLPDYTAVNLLTEADDGQARLVFSTYPTMLNRIDAARDDGPHYGPGHFDLIFVDEAHRSVYNLYRQLFEYFDALLIGLTATPKDGIDHNTYGLFDRPDDDPTYHYGLDEAVEQGYLVGYDNYALSTEFLDRGIRYRDLSAADRERYEATFRDDATGLFPEEIDAGALNQWLFNRDTVDKVLDALMQHGLRIEGGDSLGRTLIFAANQHHAEFVTRCFEENYPTLSPGFIRVVHNGVSHAETLIKDFQHPTEERLPRVAVSVDMMDTGVDAPRVLNLVFFKVVRSYAKFWQMIGRGTRLCPDVFGPDDPKTRFRIFDVGKNFEFFEVERQRAETTNTLSVSQRLFQSRLQLARLLATTGDADNLDLARTHLDALHTIVADLQQRTDEFRVRMQRRYIDRYADRAVWDALGADQIHEINTYLLPLVPPAPGDERQRRFDLLTLQLQLANLLEGRTGADKLETKLLAIATQLSEKYTVALVAARRELLEQMKDPDFYPDLEQRRLEEIRATVRELVQYLDAADRRVVYTELADSDLTMGEAPAPAFHNKNTYRRRAERFLRENRTHLAVRKLSTNQPITGAELQSLEALLFGSGELGTREDFERVYGAEPLGKFVRSILGLDVEAARAVFSEFLRAGNLSADQMRFVDNIVSYLTQNGTLDPKLLFEPPFTRQHDQGLFGVFSGGNSARLVALVREVNRNAVG